MALFETAYSFVLPNEAGTPPSYKITADPARHHIDAKAIAGINSAFFPSDFAFIASLPEDQRALAVAAYYQRVWWNRWLGNINSNAVAAVVMDAQVNMGASVGTELLQGALCDCGHNVGVDGAFGPITVAAVNSVLSASLVQAFQAARADKYRAIGGPNLGAWLRRAALTPNFD